ncbi:hypothetical protein SEA_TROGGLEHUMPER_9 [Rhodococcus phage Trogglehumper]|uniref:Uncharacterized protein n=1 Tax=Rhodococcus phage Trogglehumper TaxID=3038381 RepID=A0AAF0K2P4_9CAUD|nr:hypothetical protein SEA_TROGGLEHUMPER_9 [Rhodococcus phage Trogglehumper]
MDDASTRLVAFVQARLLEEMILAEMTKGDESDWMAEWHWGRMPDGRFINRNGLRWFVTPGVDGAHINTQSPERILADVHGKRNIVNYAVDVLTNSFDEDVRGVWTEVLRNLARKWSDHSAFDADWTVN